MSHGHRRVELISIDLHQIVATRLDEELLGSTRVRLSEWLRTVPAASPIAEDWRSWLELLEQPIPVIAQRIVEDTEQMRHMRQNTPFAGVASEGERQAILAAHPLRISAEEMERNEELVKILGAREDS